jgi:hypothetical protein
MVFTLEWLRYHDKVYIYQAWGQLCALVLVPSAAV